jgi:hypothetical protein
LLRVAAQAHCTSTVLSHGAPYRSRRDMTLPALSLSCGQSPAYERKCPTVAKRLMSTPVSAMITDAAVALTPLNRHQSFDRGAKGLQRSLDLRFELAGGLVQVLDHLQVLLKQEPMMGGNLAVQRLSQGFARRRQLFAAQRCQLSGIGLPGDERLEHPPPARAKHVRHYRSQLHIGVLEHLLDALLVLHHLAHQLLAGPGQVAQFLPRNTASCWCSDQVEAQLASLTSISASR